MFICFFARFSLNSLFPWKLMLDLSLPCLDEHVGMLFDHFWECLFLSKVWCWFFFCAIHACCCVLMKIDAGPLFALPCWVFLCIQFHFLEFLWKTRFVDDEDALLFMNPNSFEMPCPESVCWTCVWSLLGHAPIESFRSMPLNDFVWLNESQNYQRAILVHLFKLIHFYFTHYFTLIVNLVKSITCSFLIQI